MKNLRPLLSLYICFVVFGIGSRQFLTSGHPDSDNFQFAFWGLILATTILVIPFMAHMPYIFMSGLWVSAYLFLEGISGLFQQISSLDSVYVVVITIVQLFILVFLSQRIGQEIQKLEFAIFNLGLDGTLAEVSDKDVMASIHDELMRSRYSERPLSMILVNAEPNSDRRYTTQTVQNILNRYQNKYQIAELARSIQKETRLIDKVLRDNTSDQLIIVCPELDSAQSEQFGRQLKETIQTDLAMNITCQVASFPDDGVTFNGLLRKAVTNQQPSSTDYHDIINQAARANS